MHIRFVSFSVEVLFQSAARFRELKREGGPCRPPWRKRRPPVSCASKGERGFKIRNVVHYQLDCQPLLDHYHHKLYIHSSKQNYYLQTSQRFP